MSLIYLFLLICLTPYVKAKCNLEESLPAQYPWVLSNKQSIMVPTLAKDFQALVVFGRMNNGVIEKILKKSHLYPIQLKLLNKTYSVGALSFFNYRDSDMGSFREIYLVVVASKKKMNAFSSFKTFLQTLRSSDVPQETDLVLFHLKAYSSSERGVLGSRELWKIDSEFAKIQEKQSGKWLEFSLESQDGNTAVSSFDLNSFIKFPGSKNINIDASGPVFEGEQAFSHVMSCSKAAYSIFNPNRHRISVNEDMKMLLDQYGFKPWLVEYSPHSQAIQFPPR